MKTKNVFKRILVLLLAVCVIGSLTGCGSSSSDSQDESVTEGTDDQVTTITFASFATTLQPIIAEELGYFDEELADFNVDINIVTFDSGSEIREAMEAGEAELGILGTAPVVLANNNGTALRIYGTYKTTEECNAVVVRTDAGIESTSDLKGKRIGYLAGTTLHQLLLKVLEDGGLTEDDVELYDMSVAEITTALQSGDLDAGVIWEPYITSVLSDDIVQLIDGTDLMTEVCGYIVEESYLEENFELVSAVLTALERAQQYIEANEDEAISIIADFSGSEEDSIRAIIDKSDGSTALTDEKITGIGETAEYLYDQGLVDTLYAGEDLIDTSVQEAIGLTAE